MRPILFSKSATTFTSNGLGRLECTRCIVTEERNGIYELEAEIPESGELASSVEMDSILYCKPSEGASMQAFRVYKITKPIKGIFTVLAQHISYQLSNIPSMPFSITASASACSQTLAGLKSHAAESCPFTFWTDVVTVASYNQTIPASIRQRLGGVEGSVLDQFGGEYEWDNWTVKFHANRGVINPTVTLKYGKNITDLSQEEEIASTVTGICPYWVDSEGGDVVTIDEKVVESQYADNYAYRRTIPLDLSQQFQSKPTKAQLKTKAQAYLGQTGIGIPKVSIDVSFVHLADTEEYKDVAPLETVKLCDVVNVYFEKLGISTTAKVVKTVYNVLTEKYESVSIGNVRTNLATTISNTDGAIEQVQNRTTFDMSRMSNDLQEDIDNATAWLTSSGGYVIANKDSNGNWKELFFASSTNLTASSTKVLRINNNGIGFSSTGINGPYTQAWTLDGKLVVGGTNVPSLTVYLNNNQQSTKLFQIDKDGMEVNSTNLTIAKNGTMTAQNANIVGKFVNFPVLNPSWDAVEIYDSRISFRSHSGSTIPEDATYRFQIHSDADDVNFFIDTDLWFWFDTNDMKIVKYNSQGYNIGGTGYTSAGAEQVCTLSDNMFDVDFPINLRYEGNTLVWESARFGHHPVCNGFVIA